jgi:hypothetical protein
MRSADTGSRTIVNFNDLPEMTAREFEAIADAFATDEHEHEDGDGYGDGCWWHFEVRQPVISDRRRLVVPGGWGGAAVYLTWPNLT